MSRNQKMYLIFPGRFPSEKADSVFAAKSAESFARAGLEVVLIVPRRIGRFKGGAFQFYNVEKNFKIKYLPVLDFFSLFSGMQKFAFYLSIISFSLSSFIFLLIHYRPGEFIYSNGILALFFPSLFWNNVFYELHDFPENKKNFYRILFARLKGMVVTNRWKREKIKEQYALEEGKIFCVPNAVDIEKFDQPISMAEAREKLALPKERLFIGYVGKYKTMGMEKGVSELIAAFKDVSAKIPEAFLLIVGPEKNELEEIRGLFEANEIDEENYRLVSHVSQNEIVNYLKAADALVMNYPENRHYAYYMSPMKMFEYMAVGRPIVATDLPSIREILNSTSAILVKPDDPAALAAGIIEALSNSERARELAGQAKKAVREFSWDKRAKKILEFMNK